MTEWNHPDDPNLVGPIPDFSDDLVETMAFGFMGTPLYTIKKKTLGEVNG